MVLTCLNAKKNDQGLSVSLSNGSEIDTDCLLFATGRKPNTFNLGLEKTRVSIDKDGAIKTNKLTMLTFMHSADHLSNTGFWVPC